MKLILFLLMIFSFLSSCAQTEISNSKGENIILLHGFGRSKTAMWKLAGRLEDAGYAVHRVGYSSLTQDIDAIKKEVYQQIDVFLKATKNKTHFVGHSFGGLLIRSYLSEKTVTKLGNVVVMGSPSKGTPVVDYLKDKWYFEFAGPSVMTMSSLGSDFLNSLKKPNYNLGVIAGHSEDESDEHILKGKDDGLVPVESTKVEGMKDFIIIKTSHTMMRYNKDVAKQTLYFLERDKFLRDNKF